MKNLLLIIACFSVSLSANNPCDGLVILANPTPVHTDPQHHCKPEQDLTKNRIVIRKPGYPGLITLEEVANHEINTRNWCAAGGHFYINVTGHIFEGRPESMKGANEVNGADGNTGKLGIQVLLPEDVTELPSAFIGNFTQLVLCKMQQHQIVENLVKAHFYEVFHPGALVQQVIDSITSASESSEL